MQLLNMQTNKVISMYNIEDDLNSLKSDLEFDKNSIDDLHKRLDNRLSKKQSLVINSSESLAD
jgi:predicted kinase